MKRSLIIISSLLVLSLGFTSFNTDGFEVSKQIEVFASFFSKLDQNYVDEINPAELMGVAIKAIVKELDPYTKFWSEQDVEASKIRSSGEYTGIGAVVHMHNKKLYITEPFKNFPADKSGLKAGDEIIKIDDIVIANYEGEPKELLKGETGSKAVITYIRQGKTQITNVSRGKIEVNAVPFYKLLSDNTGYIVLKKFNQKASSETIAALKELKAAGADKIILDLRGNPGGLLTEAVNVSNIFIPKNQKIVHTESVVDTYKKEYKTKRDPIDLDIPLAVIINGRSASASEIVSGVIQDLDRGVVIGSRSYGKGLVQSQRDLKYNTKLKVTTSRYFMPTGRCIQALDYWNKDEDDKPIRTKDIDYKAFKTLNTKRTVYDGGGVFPDIEIEGTKHSKITSALLKEKIIFNFATEYYSSHKFKDLASFNFSKSDYQNFLSYIRKNNFVYETKTEKTLKEAMDYAVKEEIDKSITREYDDLMKKITISKQASIILKEKEIKQRLINEILKRYFYQEGMYEYNITHSEEIKKAQEVLASPATYDRILGK